MNTQLNNNFKYILTLETMKILNLLQTLIIIVLSSVAIGQVNPGASCDQAGCSANGSYPSLTGVPSMGTFGCLGSTPNANWVAIGVSANGNIDITLTQGGDVDFAAYGPFSSVAAGCPIGPGTPQVDCSFSASSTEYINIPNAQVGQVYIILITNYSNSAGTINLNVTNGSINCNINFSGTATMTPATCGQATGSVTVTPNGGFAPYTYSWNTPGNPTTQTVNNVAPGTYTVTITSSNDPVTGATANPTTATVTVTNQSATYSTTTVPATCSGSSDGSITANFNAGGAPGVTATYLWNDPGAQTTQTATGLAPGAYQCTVTLSNGCSGVASGTIGFNATANFTSSTTQVSCPGGSDGTAIASMNPVLGNISYQWNDPANQTTQTATGLSAGQYTCIVTSDLGCNGSQTVTVTEVPALIGVITSQTDASCNSASNGIIDVNVTQGTAPYSYSWDNSASTSDIANDLAAGTHTVTVTDFNGCIITVTGVIAEPAALDITSITPSTQICPEDDIMLTATGAGGSSPYTFTWYEGATQIGTGPSITVDPTVTNTEYCVVLSEACGSPTDEECTIIYFPTPIVPNAIADEYEKCMPGRFEFFNTSSNISEIASTYWQFGPQGTALETGSDSTHYQFNKIGIFDVIMTTTSIYGCVYTDTLKQFVAVKPNPIADFTFSTNPTTIWETAIQLQDRSSVNVIDWNWYSPNSTPSSSTLSDPKFYFPEEVGVYPVTLIVSTELGCYDTLTLYLHVVQDILFFAPNAFTPDGDENNQVWKPEIQGIDIYDFDLFIFNRWGELIWENHDPSMGWDGTYNGKIVQTGMYTWRARVKDMYNDSKHEFNGTINLLK